MALTSQAIIVYIIVIAITRTLLTGNIITLEIFYTMQCCYVGIQYIIILLLSDLVTVHWSMPGLHSDIGVFLGH